MDPIFTPVIIFLNSSTSSSVGPSKMLLSCDVVEESSSLLVSSKSCSMGLPGGLGLVPVFGSSRDIAMVRFVSFGKFLAVNVEKYCELARKA